MENYSMSSIITLQTAPITPVEKVKNVSDGKTYFVYNVSTNFDNWSQRNSKYAYQYKNYVTNWASCFNPLNQVYRLNQRNNHCGGNQPLQVLIP